jgi:hypothetical protein
VAPELLHWSRANQSLGNCAAIASGTGALTPCKDLHSACALFCSSPCAHFPTPRPCAGLHIQRPNDVGVPVRLDRNHRLPVPPVDSTSVGYLLRASLRRIRIRLVHRRARIHCRYRIVREQQNQSFLAVQRTGSNQQGHRGRQVPPRALTLNLSRLWLSEGG